MNAGERGEGDKRQMVRREVINGVKVVKVQANACLRESHLFELHVSTVSWRDIASLF